MNVVVANEQQNGLANLDVDIIKSITGSYNVTELVNMFKNFFYSKLILDVTALQQYSETSVYKTLAIGLDPEKIILLLPEGSILCTPNFLSQLISFGLYNFTTNLNGVRYLLKKPNTLSDVQKILTMANNKPESSTVNTAAENDDVSDTTRELPVAPNNMKVGTTVIGVRNVTNHAGATTLVYLLKREIALVYGHDSVLAIEVNKNDFKLFRQKNMISVHDSQLESTLQQYSNFNIVLIDLNNYPDDHLCSKVIYLLEPSTLKVNQLVRSNANVFAQLHDQIVVLNKSLLLNNDVSDFESEASMSFFYNLPPVNDRKRNAVIHDFLVKLGVFNTGDNTSNGNRIFGLFRR